MPWETAAGMNIFLNTQDSSMLPSFRFLPFKRAVRPFKTYFHERLKKPFRRTYSSASEQSSTLYKARREPWMNVTMLFVGFIPIFTFGLGTWQLQRLQWKQSLIEELEGKLQMEPLTLPKRINLSMVPEFIYRRVILKGRWDHSRSMLVGPRVHEGTAGVHVVTPLIRSDGSTVLVDRGFVSYEFADKVKQHVGRSEVEVLAMLRTSQVRNNFTPDNHPEEGKWYWTDVEAMAEYAGGEQADVQPVFVEEIFQGHAGEAASRLSKGIPIGRAPTVDLRNAHMSYIITWYSLSAFTSAMFIRLLMNKRRNIVRRLPR